jgi:hypothetical protein
LGITLTTSQQNTPITEIKQEGKKRAVIRDIFDNSCIFDNKIGINSVRKKAER